MKDYPPTTERVHAIVEMMESEGMWTQAKEVRLLGEHRTRCELTLNSIIGLATAVLMTGVDERLEYLQKVVNELRAAGTTTVADIEARLRKDGKLDKDTPT